MKRRLCSSKALALPALLVAVGCTPSFDEIAAYARSQYDCPADQVVSVDDNEHEACGFRFKSRCNPSLMAGNGCTFETTDEMAGENLDRGLGLFAQKELQCDDDVVVKVDKSAALDLGGHKLRDDERALVGSGCGRTLHWVCPTKGDAAAVKSCRRVSEEDLQWRAASSAILDDLRDECPGKLDLQPVSVDSATRVLHDGQLVVAAIARCQRDGWQSTQGYRCPITEGAAPRCTRAAPGPELSTAFDAAARPLVAGGGQPNIRHGQPQFEGKLAWRRWSEVTTAPGQGGYVRCTDTLLGDPSPTCKVLRPETVIDPKGRAREACEKEERCKPGGYAGALRGADGLASLVDLRTGSAEIASYRCVFQVESARYECRFDEAAGKMFGAAKQRARKAFSTGERAACPASDVSVSLSEHQRESRAWSFELKGCGEKTTLVCPDDGGACGEGPLNRSSKVRDLNELW